MSQWISNFLRERTVKVQVDGSFSSPSNVISGVPQGSCIGPLLFIIFINDIVQNIPKDVFAGIYADDLKMYARHQDSAKLQNAIDMVYDWSVSWNMRFAEKKCSVMQYGNSKNTINFYLNGVLLNKVDTMRDLGILMRPNLLFDKHIENLVLKAESRVNNILRCFKCTDISFLLKAFTTFVLPLLESDSEVWNPISPGLINALEKVQRNYTRRLFMRARLPETSYKDRLEFLGLESLERRRSLRDICFLFKVFHELTIIDVSTSFTRAPLTLNLRNNHTSRLALPFQITEKKRSTFSSRAIPVWNKLDSDIVSSESLEIFKKKVKTLPNIYFQ